MSASTRDEYKLDFQLISASIVVAVLTLLTRHHNIILLVPPTGAAGFERGLPLSSLFVFVFLSFLR